jgi:Co/Zn/Cd efflux system component
MEGIPPGIDVAKVEEFIYENFDHAKKVKELHLWSLIPGKNNHGRENKDRGQGL